MPEIISDDYLVQQHFFGLSIAWVMSKTYKKVHNTKYGIKTNNAVPTCFVFK